jgi:hypothetical protein
MKIVLLIIYSATVLGFVLSPAMKVIHPIQNQASESVMMLLLGLLLIGVARIFRAEKIKL